MSSQKFAKRTAAFSAAFAIALSAGVVGAPAMAQTPAGTEVATATKAPGAATIEEGNVHSLTIHKRVNPTALRNATGEVDAAASGKPLQGAEFSIQQVEGDIRTQAGFNKMVKLVNDYNNGTNTDAPKLVGEVKTGTTDAQGELTFGELPAGAYLVTETAAPQVEGETFVKAKPFIVMLPMTAANGESWNKNVHVYPKNSMAKVTKTVVDKDTHAEDAKRENVQKTVEYTLTGVVPAAPQGKVLKNFTLTDASKSDELRWDEGFIKSVEIRRAGQDPKVLTTADYTVTQDNSKRGPEKDRATRADQAFQIIIANPAEKGLQPDDEVVVKVQATLLQNNDQDIENSVSEQFYFRDPGQEVTPGEDPDGETPNDKVITYIGNIEVVKHDSTKKETKLDGAEFELYRGACTDNSKTLVQKGTTANGGKLSFTGLHVTNYEDNKPAAEVGYCLIETKAPEGYLLSDDVKNGIDLTLKREDRVANGTDGATIRMVSKEIANVPSSDIPVLPNTGGIGIAVLVLAGLGIIGGGAYMARRNAA